MTWVRSSRGLGISYAWAQFASTQTHKQSLNVQHSQITTLTNGRTKRLFLRNNEQPFMGHN